MCSQRLAGYGLDIVDQLWKEFGWYREALLCIKVDVAITPVSDGPGSEHHDDCEHNRSCQWQKLN